jgi:hypothetical protein
MDHVWDSKSAYRVLVETSNEEGEGGHLEDWLDLLSHSPVYHSFSFVIIPLVCLYQSHLQYQKMYCSALKVAEAISSETC